MIYSPPKPLFKGAESLGSGVRLPMLVHHSQSLGDLPSSCSFQSLLEARLAMEVER